MTWLERAARWWRRRFGAVVDEDEEAFQAAQQQQQQQEQQQQQQQQQQAAEEGEEGVRCAPIRLVGELMAWRPPACGRGGDPRASRVPLRLSAREAAARAARPRLLVCHDFKG